MHWSQPATRHRDYRPQRFGRAGAVFLFAPAEIFVQAGAPRLLDSETLDRELGNLCWVSHAGLPDLDDLLCDHLGEGIVAIFNAKGLQSLLIGRREVADLLRPHRQVL